MFPSDTKHKLMIALGFLTLCLPAVSRADGVSSLSSLSVTAYQRDGAGGVVIDTSGAARLRISFQGPDMVRVQVSPTGVFDGGPSYAVLPQVWPKTKVTISGAGTELLVKSSDITVHIEKAGIEISIYGENGKALLNADSQAGGVRWSSTDGSIGQATELAPDERIYGLGEDNRNYGTLDRRGTICDLVTGQQINSGNVTADDPVPFYLSTGHSGHGYGVYVDNSWRMKFDLGKTQSDTLDWSAPGGPIDYYVIDGPSFKSIIKKYTQLTGRPAMLPLWAFGYWQSKCTYNSFAEMRGVADELRADDIPLDVMVIDSFWPAHYVDFIWGGSWVTPGISPAQQLASMHAIGVHIILSAKGPMDRKDSPNYQSGWDAGVFVKDSSGNAITCGYFDGDLLDFTSPKMASWLWPQLKPLYNEGVDGWWLDLIEPEGAPYDVVFAAGPSAAVRNTFPNRVIGNFYDFQKSVAPTSRPVLLGRAGSASVQRYGAILWTGDTNSDWPTFRAQLPEAQNSGLSGLAWWTNDSGGFLNGFYKNDQYGAHAQLYARWLEFSSFAPIARAHKAGPPEPFDYGPVAISAARKYLGLRYRLMPYVYSCAYQTHMTGLPLLSPLVLEYQNDAVAGETKDEFLFGPDILVAPVIQEDAVSRSVYLPRGTWTGLETGTVYQGGTSVTVSAPYDTIPLFVRAGAILPTVPPMLSTGEKPWDPITLDIYPHLRSSFTMFADDGLSTAFEKGVFTSTNFTCLEVPSKSVTFTITESNKLFTPKTWTAHFHLSAVPKSVIVGSQTVSGWSYDQSTGVLEVSLKNGASKTHKILVNLD